VGLPEAMLTNEASCNRRSADSLVATNAKESDNRAGSASEDLDGHRSHNNVDIIRSFDRAIARQVVAMRLLAGSRDVWRHTASASGCPPSLTHYPQYTPPS
jgi:hypothetical protein